MSTVLIRLPDGGGVVRRGDGQIVVTEDVGGERGQSLRDGDRYGPLKVWLDDDRCLVGGLLPAGTVGAEVIDDRGTRVPAAIGGGAYAAVLEQPGDGREPVVCCRDAAGIPVRRPLPGDYPCVPVADAEEPCPACGAVDYEECVPTEGWRGARSGPDGTMIPSPIVVCRVCGHEEREGAIHRFSSPEGEDEAARAERIARRRVERWHQHKRVLRDLTFSVYAAAGWPAQINGSSSQGGNLVELTIAHTDSEDAELSQERPRIELSTSTESRRELIGFARRRLEQLVHEEVMRPHSPGLSDAAITLWFRALARRRRAVALAATRSETQIAIDGTRSPFLMLSTPSGRWVAVRRHNELTVTIAARDLDPTTITIEAIRDPAARLLGPEPRGPQ